MHIIPTISARAIRPGTVFVPRSGNGPNRIFQRMQLGQNSKGEPVLFAVHTRRPNDREGIATLATAFDQRFQLREGEMGDCPKVQIPLLQPGIRFRRNNDSGDELTFKMATLIDERKPARTRNEREPETMVHMERLPGSIYGQGSVVMNWECLEQLYRPIGLTTAGVIA